MAGFVERISVIIDAKTDGALSGLRGFKTAISEAEGFSGKLKAGWKNATQQISANAGALAVAGGAALIAFGKKALDVFEDTAKAAGDMAKATGLSTEQASRWIAVGDDYGVTADQLSTAMLRLGKNMDASAMHKYGIETRDAAGNAKDANDIFLDVLEVLNNTAPAERAKVGAELLGKGWAGVAPILGHTRDEYADMLATVEDGQVITEKERKKAEKMALAQDKLGDATKEFTLAVGEAATGLAPLVEKLADVVAYANELGLIESLIPPASTDSAVERVGSVSDAMRDLAVEALKSGDAVAYLMDHGFTRNGAINMLRDYHAEMAASVEATQEMSPSAYDASRMLDKQTDSTEDATDALSDLDDLLKDLSDENAALDLADDFADVEQASKDAFYAVASGADDADQKLRDAQRTTNNAKRDLAEYALNVKGLPASAVTKIIAEVDDIGFAEAKRKLDLLAASRDARIVPVVANPGTGGGSGGGKNGPGGSLASGESFTAGRSGAGNITVNVYATGDGRAMVDAITAAVKDGVKAAWMAA